MWGCVVKAPSAWLTYIGSLPLTSHHGSSLTNTGPHTHACVRAHTHTHILYPSLRRLCSLMPCLHFLPLFRSLLPSLFVPFGICVWLGTSNICSKKNCAAVSGLTKKELSKHTPFILPPEVNLITCVYCQKGCVTHIINSNTRLYIQESSSQP